ncbi:beta-ketoacyl synthase N-terminal-like domain-containing protein [Streptomyces sp. NPDC047917]|uniref:beta-ketoacyl synthase N-terminal-like domain-containing protein n=1 Tax=Streptomyces sp. NPDC047917 TaxID=3365491 RepID=UPI003714BF2C
MPLSAGASGAEALAPGQDLIRGGRAGVVVAGGAEACPRPFTIAASAGTEALPTQSVAPTTGPAAS